MGKRNSRGAVGREYPRSVDPDDLARERRRREAAAARRVMDPPAHLSRYAKCQFRRLVRLLYADDRPPTLDQRDSLASFAVSLEIERGAILALQRVTEQARLRLRELRGRTEETRAEWDVLQIVIASGGTLIPGRQGDTVKNPAVVNLKAASEAVRKFSVEYGLTPMSRRGAVPVSGSAREAGDAGLAGFVTAQRIGGQGSGAE